MLGGPMRLRASWLRLIVLALGLGLAAPAVAKPKPRAPAKTAKPSAEAAPERDDKKDEPASAEPEPAVKAAGTSAAKAASKEPQTKVTAVEESEKDKGVKTYKFSAVEVEGRLKSPQIAYFLRRVRAEFEAGDLGHRSFMPELSDSRRSPSLR
jgi:hypothetical protein